MRTKHWPKVMLNEIREMLGVDVCICRPANALKAAKTFGAQESWRKIQLSNKKRNTHGILGLFSTIRIFVGPLGITCFCQTNLGESPLGVGLDLGLVHLSAGLRDAVSWRGAIIGGVVWLCGSMLDVFLFSWESKGP